MSKPSHRRSQRTRPQQGPTALLGQLRSGHLRRRSEYQTAPHLRRDRLDAEHREVAAVEGQQRQQVEQADEDVERDHDQEQVAWALEERLLGGVGDSDLLNWSTSAKWLVVEVCRQEVVSLGGKVKFPRGNVVHCGDRLSATRYLLDAGCSSAIVGAVVTGGYRSTVTGGDCSIVVARWFDAAINKYRLAHAEVGQHGRAADGDPEGRFLAEHRSSAALGRVGVPGEHHAEADQRGVDDLLSPHGEPPLVEIEHSARRLTPYPAR